MARIYRRGRTWWLDYYDWNGARQRVTSGTDRKSEAQQVLARVVNEQRLRRAGLWEPGAELRGRPIAEHVAAFETHLEAKNRTKKHRTDLLRLVRLFVAEAGVQVLAELTLARGEAWLARLTREGLAARTVNKSRAALLQWGRWLVRARRLVANPFDGLPTQDQEAGRVRERRALTVPEVAALFRVVPVLRRIVYELAMVTGLRRAELEALRPDQLDGELLHFKAAQAKNRRGRVFRLPARLATELASLLVQATRLRLCVDARMKRPPREGFLLPTVPSKATFYRDLIAAGITRVREPGEGLPNVVVDFHSLRVTYGTLLDRAGASLPTAQRLMRHSDPRLTSNVYTDVGDAETAMALGSVWAILDPLERPGTKQGTARTSTTRKARRKRA